MELPWSKGPSLKTLGPIRRWEVVYRYRPFGEPDWNLRKITVTARSEASARSQVGKFISKRSVGRIEAEIRKVRLMPAEVAVQDGDKPTEVVSDQEYQERKTKELESIGGQKAVEERLRELGMWLPGDAKKN